jgi:uncharacterized damage-inducible protein DinB
MSQNDCVSIAVKQQLAEYFQYLAKRIERLAHALPAEKFWVKPFPFGNSVGHLIVHITGSVNQFIGVRCAGMDYDRDRAAEFSDASGRSVDEVLAKFQEAINVAVTALGSHNPTDLQSPVTFSGEPVKNQFGLFLVSAAHMNNHIGQIAYLLHAHEVHLDEQSW